MSGFFGKLFGSKPQPQNDFEYDPTGSPDYQRFWKDFIDPKGDYFAWHDGVDETVFARLTPEERLRAEAAMLRRLPNWRAIIGLGAIGSQAAVEPLQKLRAKTKGEELVRIEQALARLGIQSASGGDRIRQVLLQQPPPLADALRQSQSRSARMDAALALRNFPSQPNADALAEAMATDPEYLVRFHSASSLLAMHGYTRKEVDEAMKNLAPKLGNKFAVSKGEVIGEIRALAEARPLGKAPTE